MRLCSDNDLDRVYAPSKLSNCAGNAAREAAFNLLAMAFAMVVVFVCRSVRRPVAAASRVAEGFVACELTLGLGERVQLRQLALLAEPTLDVIH